VPNRVRWNGQAGPFYEVWYFIIQRPATAEAFWIRYTLLNPRDDRPEAGGGLWFAYARRGDPDAGFAIHKRFPGSALEAVPGAVDLGIGEARLGPRRLKGGFEADGHAVSWDLTYEESQAPHYYFGPLLRGAMENRTSVTLPNPRAFFRGRVCFDGREATLEGDVGHQAHHWGRERAKGWRWAHCAFFQDGHETVFEALAADKPPLPTLTFLRLADGGSVDQTSLLAALRNRAEVETGVWRFVGRGLRQRLEVELTCDPRALLRFAYHSPRYELSYCYNSPVADARVRLYRRSSPFASWVLARELRAEGTANAEIVVPAEEDRLYGSNQPSAVSTQPEEKRLLPADR
jgi:hypothetical protein